METLLLTTHLSGERWGRVLTSCTFLHVAWPGAGIPFSQTGCGNSKDRGLIEAHVVIACDLLSFPGSGGGTGAVAGLWDS